MSYLTLKSGTDVRGTAVVTAAHPEFELTDKTVSDISASFILFLSEKTGKNVNELKVSLGHDSRISAMRIKDAVANTLVKMGVNVLYCSYCSTPAMFMTTVTENCDGAIQITASHHPYDRNGLKFFLKSGGLSGEELTEILTVADTVKIPENDGGKITEIDYISKYAEALRGMIKNGVNAEDFEHPLKDFKIAVDAGNGVGGFYAAKVLEPLGADVSASQFLEIDGMFPNHIPNPENKTAMEFIRRATVENGCDLGVIFDTDVDRASCVDEKGDEINRNSIVALASVIALEGNDGGSIVTDSVTSDGLRDFIENTLGGKQIRFKRGYKNVIDEAIRRENEGENVPLAIETSGHAAFRENYYLDDGAYLIVKLLISLSQLAKEGKDLTSLISSLKKPAEEAEIRIGFGEKSQNFKAEGAKVIEELKAIAANTEGLEVEKVNYEGVRIYFKGGLMLVRMSVHDPVMPINFESEVKGGNKIMAKTLLSFLSAYPFLDTTKLSEFINN